MGKKEEIGELEKWGFGRCLNSSLILLFPFWEQNEKPT